MILKNISKNLQGAQDNMCLSLDLNIQPGQLVTLYGESGAGKTSTLRIIAGLMKPNKGSLSVNGKVWFDANQGINLKPQQRKIGYVFQDYALFPNMTVRKNLEFGLQKNDDRKRVTQLISMVELEALQDRKPDTLSGGQKQRVALARALVQKPEILLLDEPLAALDIKIRSKLQQYIARVHQEYNLTTILVSHDIGEIHKLSDWVYMLENGRIIKQGTPTDLFLNKKISGKFKFTGEVVKIEPQDVVCVVTVLIQTQLVKIIAQESELENLNIGDKVGVASKAFNPVIYKID